MPDLEKLSRIPRRVALLPCRVKPYQAGPRPAVPCRALRKSNHLDGEPAKLRPPIAQADQSASLACCVDYLLL